LLAAAVKEISQLRQEFYDGVAVNDLRSWRERCSRCLLSSFAYLSAPLVLTAQNTFCQG